MSGYQVVEKVGSHGDAARRAYAAWAASLQADTRREKGNAMTAKQILPLVLAAHRALVDDLDAQLDISAKGLSDMLAASARADPQRFMKLDKPVRYRVVPIQSFLEVKTLPSNKGLYDRRAVKRLKEAKAENKELRAEVDEGRRAAARDQRLIGRLQAVEKKLAAKSAGPRTEERPEVDPSKLYGTRFEHSQHFKVLMRDAMACMPGASMRQWSRMAAYIARAFAHDARNQTLTPELIVRMMPCKDTLSSWQDEQGDVDDYKLAQRLQKFAEGFYEVADAGNKKGIKMNFESVAFFDFDIKCVDFQFANNNNDGGGGKESAIAVQKTAGRFRTRAIGSGTDSAGDVLVTMVKEMRAICPGFVAAACFLHVLNAILMNSYMESFGDEMMGIPGALRRGFLTAYLIDKFYETSSRATSTTWA